RFHRVTSVIRFPPRAETFIGRTWRKSNHACYPVKPWVSAYWPPSVYSVICHLFLRVVKRNHQPPQTSFDRRKQSVTRRPHPSTCRATSTVPARSHCLRARIARQTTRALPQPIHSPQGIRWPTTLWIHRTSSEQAVQVFTRLRRSPTSPAALKLCLVASR